MTRPDREQGCGGDGQIYVENGSPAMQWQDDDGRFYDDCPGCDHPRCPARSTEGEEQNGG